ncbi:MAG: DUF1292 domain-containing protein [Lachnospiraceae bacterium]|nr:DUF1292 domain-containing protein [Lachnospiraceae bacterium]
MASRDQIAEEEMTVSLELDNGETVECAIVTIFEMEGRDYIALLPTSETSVGEAGDVWIYRYSENPDDPNEEPELTYIDDEDEYERASDAFDEYLDSCEFDELVDSEDSED